MFRWSRNLLLVILAIVLVGPVPATAQTELGGLEDLYSWPEDPTNLVDNPSFEETDETGNPHDWMVGSPFNLFPDTIEPHTGSWSMHLKDSDQASWTPNARQLLSIDPGWYNLRGWMKADNAGTNTLGSGGRISIRGVTSSEVISGTTDWTQVERQSFRLLPENSYEIRLNAYLKPDGNIFYDDIGIYGHVRAVR